MFCEVASILFNWLTCCISIYTESTNLNRTTLCAEDENEKHKRFNQRYTFLKEKICNIRQTKQEFMSKLKQV